MPLKVLIVDDEPDLELLVRQRFRKQIKDGELDFVFATHGEEALEYLKGDPSLDIVMSDINMPVMDGLTLLSRLPELNRTVKTVIVSAYSDIQNIRTAMNRGAYDFLTKPIDFQDFEITLQKTTKEIEAIKEGIKAREHLIATLNVVADLSSELQLGPMLEKIVKTITNMLGAERSTLFLYDEKKKQLYTKVGEGLETSEIRIPADVGIAGTVFTTSRPIRIADAYRDSRFNPEVDRQTGFVTRSILCTPVVNKEGRTIGVTQVLNKKNGSFTEDDESRLNAFTSEISIALENAKLFDDVQTIRNYNESILESMSSGVITLDEDWMILTCNAAARRITKATDDIIGTSATTFFAGPNSWILERLNALDPAKGDDVTMDAELWFGEEKVSANVTILPLFHVRNTQSGLMIMIEDITTERRLRSTMSRYLDVSIVDTLLQSKTEALGGQSSIATVLFSDIRNFTTMAESLGAHDTVKLLNEYFTLMVDCIQREGGMLDKFIGDAVMAEFGIPLPHDDDEDRAVRAAIAMHRQLRQFNERFTSPARQPLGIRIGVNTDFVVSGNIGSPKRMDYTVIGDGVNLASRMESACKEYGTGLMLSESTFAKLKDKYQTREIDRVIFKGKSKPIRIFDVLDFHTPESFPNMPAVLNCFNDGVRHYRLRKWDFAVTAFKEALRLNPSDSTSAMYMRRCEHLKESPPGEAWSGVWVMTSK
jgi:adenylate cyclase